MGIAAAGRYVVIGAGLLLTTGAATAVPPALRGPVPVHCAPAGGLSYQFQPIVIKVADVAFEIDSATVSDVAVADFNGDGRNDIAVAWYVTDNGDLTANVRMLSIFLNDGTGLHLGASISLYVLNSQSPALSVFRYGTGTMAVGDFDGDGDPDLAVLPFYGDEFWVIENLGGGNFAARLKYLFGINTSTDFCTPPEALAADFDGDGRDELVYIADATSYWDGEIIHFWKTSGAIVDMYRTDWTCDGCSPNMSYTRGLALADFDGDGRPDLSFSGTTHRSQELNPIFTVWYSFDVATGYFRTHDEIPSIICADVIAARAAATCLAGVILTDINGTTAQYWGSACSGPVDLLPTAEVSGYAGISPNRGMGGVVADINGDGNLDLVTKQKIGAPADAGQIEITLGAAGGTGWILVTPSPIDTTGFQTQASNQHLRSRNLAVADLFGNTLPEIVAGFAATDGSPAKNGTGRTLSIAIWQNSCLGDVTRDGRTNWADISALTAALGACRGSPPFNPDADLDRDGCVTSADVAILMRNLGCLFSGETALRRGDLNCDEYVDLADINPFVTALTAPALYESEHPYCHLLNADCNGDGIVSYADINAFVALLGSPSGPSSASRSGD